MKTLHWRWLVVGGLGFLGFGAIFGWLLNTHLTVNLLIASSTSASGFTKHPSDSPNYSQIATIVFGITSATIAILALRHNQETLRLSYKERTATLRNSLRAKTAETYMSSLRTMHKATNALDVASSHSAIGLSEDERKALDDIGQEVQSMAAEIALMASPDCVKLVTDWGDEYSTRRFDITHTFTTVGDDVKSKIMNDLLAKVVDAMRTELGVDAIASESTKLLESLTKPEET